MNNVNSQEPRYANSTALSDNVGGTLIGENTTGPTPRVSGTFEAVGAGNQTYVRSGRMAGMARQNDRHNNDPSGNVDDTTGGDELTRNGPEESATLNTNARSRPPPPA